MKHSSLIAAIAASAAVVLLAGCSGADSGAAPEGGGTYTWLANEHCLVLMGYDNENYYFSDPYKGAVVKYKKALCQSRYQAFGQQALAIK